MADILYNCFFCNTKFTAGKGVTLITQSLLEQPYCSNCKYLSKK